MLGFSRVFLSITLSLDLVPNHPTTLPFLNALHKTRLPCTLANPSGASVSEHNVRAARRGHPLLLNFWSRSLARRFPRKRFPQCQNRTLSNVSKAILSARNPPKVSNWPTTGRKRRKAALRSSQAGQEPRCPTPESDASQLNHSYIG
jgi:hypothetical protein